MTTQHVPHTPLWRQVLSLPKTAYGWWAVGLAGLASLLFAITDWTEDNRLLILGVSVTWGVKVLAPLVTFTWTLSGVAGGVVAYFAVLLRHERSVLVWVAMVLGLGAFLVFIVLLVFLIVPTIWELIGGLIS